MTTTKSYSNGARLRAMYVSTLKNHIAFAIVAGIIYIILIPVIFFAFMPGMIRYSYWNSTPPQFHQLFDAGIYLGGFQSGVVTFAALILTFVLAINMGKYLFSKKMTDLYHSLPIRRPQMLLAHFLAAMTILIGPLVAVYMVTMVAQLLIYAWLGGSFFNYFLYIFLDLLFLILQTVSVYLFVTFISVNVGTGFDAFALSSTIGFAPTLLYLICGGMWSMLSYGFEFMPVYGLMLSPYTFSFQRYLLWDAYAYGSNNSFIVGYVVLFGVWLLLTVGAYVGAVLTYNRRKSEIAGQAQSRGVFQTMVKCFIAFLGAAAFYGIFYSAFTPIRIAASIFGAVFIGLIAELILSRGVRYMLKNALWLVGTGVVFSLFVLEAQFDLLGIASRVPDPLLVDSVYVDYQGRFSELSVGSYGNGKSSHDEANWRFTQPETIRLITEVHRMAVDNRPSSSDYWSRYSEDYSYVGITIRYHLKTGGTITRNYDTVYDPALIKLAELEDKEEFVRTRSSLFYIDEYLGLDQLSLIRSVTLYDPLCQQEETVRLSDWEKSRLIQAIQEDMLTETLEEIQNPAAPIAGYIQIDYETDSTYSENRTFYTYSSRCSTVIVAQHYHNTIRALREMELYQYFQPELSCEKVYLVPYNDTGVGMKTFLPSSYAYQYYNRYYYNDEEIMYYTSPLEILSVADIAHSQLMSRGAETSNQMVIALFTWDDDETMVARPVYFRDLPAAMQYDCRIWYDDQYGISAFQYDEITEEVAARPQDLTTDQWSLLARTLSETP